MHLLVEIRVSKAILKRSDFSIHSAAMRGVDRIWFVVSCLLLYRDRSNQNRILHCHLYRARYRMFNASDQKCLRL